jgi:hypothetical protein
MADIIFDTGGPSINLSAAEMELMDEISVKPTTRSIPIVKSKPKPKPMVDGNMDAFINPSKRVEEQQYGPPPEAGEMEDEEEGGGEQYEYAQGQEPQPSEGYKTIADEKADLLNKLTRLQKKGFSQNKKFSIHSDLEDLRTEYKRITYGIEADQSIKFQRRMLIACVSGLEFMNKRFDPFDVHLDGWSESMMENLDDYDPVFEDLYAKYRDKVKVAPEIRLIMMVGGSAMMFHLTNSMFKSAIPNMNDVLSKNPELVKNMMEAIQNTASGTRMPPPTVGGPREMKGPGLDISSLLGGFGMPMPANTRIVESRPPPIPEEDTISDIVSVSSEGDGTRDITLSGPKRKRRSKKNEVSI